MLPLVVIQWTVDPVIVEVGPIQLRWYGILFATGFAVGYKVIHQIFRKEQLPTSWLDPLLLYLIVGGLLGARLGHVFFYDWADFKDQLSEIPMIWRGGLASHGGAIGVLIAFWLFSQRISKKPMIWIMDRCAPGGAIGAMFIRLGNLMNHEIVGVQTDLPWGFVFHRRFTQEVPLDQMGMDLPALHPAQLYEAIAYLFIFFVLSFCYRRYGADRYPGLLTGLYLVLLFTARFVIEFWKANQVAFEENMSLNMGQWLSIPLILLGIGFILRAFSKKFPSAANNLSSSDVTQDN